MLCVCEKIVVVYSICKSTFDSSLTKVQKSKFGRQIAFCTDSSLTKVPKSKFVRQNPTPVTRVTRSKYPANQKLVVD